MKTKTFIKSLIIYSFILLFVLSPLMGLKTAKADSSSSSGYTTALEDLAGCKEFMEGDFPQVQNDYSVNVITIGESVNKELFIYVYQPSAYSVSLKASSINISTEIGRNLSFKNYKLKHISSEGVYQKYLVEDFNVKTDNVRYYSISSIFRKWDKILDKNTSATNENFISEVVYPVAREYKFETKNGQISYSVQDTEVVTITDKYVGYLEYNEGFFLSYKACRSHFIAFSTDYQIDALMEADVFYVKQDVTLQYYVYTGEDYTYGNESNEYAYLTYTDKVVEEGEGIFGSRYEWERIQSVEEFIENEKLTSEGKEDISNKEWVLRFVETDMQIVNYGNGDGYYKEYTDVKDVTILRLKFMSGDKIYNLGVIDNKQWQEGSKAPDNHISLFENGCNGCNGCNGLDSWVWITLACIGIIIILVKVLKNNGGK